MKTGGWILVCSLAACVLLWFADAAVDSAVFHHGAFSELAFTKIEPSTIYDRGAGIIVVAIFGLVTWRILSARDAALRQVADKERYYRSVLQDLHEEIMVIDQDLTVVDANDTALRAAGQGRQQVVGRKCYQVSHGCNEPCEQRGEACALREVFRTGQPKRCRHVHVRPDGRTAHVEILLSPLKSPDGTVISVIEAIRDVTGLVAAEQELQKSLALLTAVVEGTSELVFVKDLQGRYLMANAAALKALGKSSQEVLGHDDRDIMPPPQAEQARSGDRQVMESGRTLTVEQTTQQDGQTRQWVIAKSPYRDAGGQVVGVFGLAHDVTEQRKMLEQLRQAQKMEAVGRLAGGVAHDFNNLLTPILGYSELLLGNADLPNDIRESVEQIHRAGGRARDLTMQLLAFGRKQVLEMHPTDLNEVVASCGKMLRRLIKESVRVEVSPADGLRTVQADPAQVEQVLMNLVINADQAMPDGGWLNIETANVDLDSTYAETHPEVHPGPHVQISVSDTGMGMDAKVRELIFEPFFTTKGRQQSMGMGLATVHGIVKQHGGSISVYSEPGKGSTFRVYFPAVRQAAQALPEGAALAAPTGTETVLVVEDDQAVRDLACDMLRRQGYTVLEAGEPQAALALAERYEGTIHLLLTDVVMPKMNGEELRRRLSALRPGIKTVYMSGYTSDVIAHHGVLSPGTHFIPKPFTAADLAEKVRHALAS
jgi:PAS domain S-box-containing protein